MLIKNIKEITTDQAKQFYKELGVAFIIRDGKLKGMIKEPKQINNKVIGAQKNETKITFFF